MRVLAYLNISNIDDIESDSGYIFNYLLASSFEKMGIDYFMIIPQNLKGKKLRFDLERCFFVDMGVTKYEARYRFDWSNIERIICEMKPDIVFNNQVELTSSFRALLIKNDCDAKLFTYCHYPAIHIDNGKDVIIDKSLDLNGLGENIVCNILCSINISDVFMIQSNFAKNLLLKYSKKININLNKDIVVLHPPYDDQIRVDNIEKKERKKILYNHRLYDSYGTDKFIEFVKTNHDMKFVVTDPMANRGKEREKYNNSPKQNRNILEEMKNVSVFDGGDHKKYIDIIDDCCCAIAPYRESCVWSMSVIDCYCRGVPVVAPCIAAFEEFVPKQLLYRDVEQEKKLIIRLIEDSNFWRESVLMCKRFLGGLSPELTVKEIIRLF